MGVFPYLDNHEDVCVLLTWFDHQNDPLEIKLAENDISGNLFQKPISLLKHTDAFNYNNTLDSLCSLRHQFIFENVFLLCVKSPLTGLIQKQNVCLFNYLIPWTYHENELITNESLNIISKVWIFLIKVIIFLKDFFVISESQKMFYFCAQISLEEKNLVEKASCG